MKKMRSLINFRKRNNEISDLNVYKIGLLWEIWLNINFKKYTSVIWLRIKVGEALSPSNANPGVVNAKLMLRSISVISSLGGSPVKQK